METKEFFRFEIIIDVLVRSFCQIQTCKNGPRAKRVTPLNLHDALNDHFASV